MIMLFAPSYRAEGLEIDFKPGKSHGGLEKKREKKVLALVQLPTLVL